jgi:hypothetical protein
MSTKSTKRVSVHLTTARERGLIPWEWIVDDTRPIERPATWRDTSTYAKVVQDSYRKDRWADQPWRLLVMSEKAVGGILRPVLDEYGVPFVITHGFNSTTILKNLADESVRDDRPFSILYVGDHDPSGLHMPVVDLPRRLERYGGIARVHRVALLDHHLPGLASFRAEEKNKDSRYKWYVPNFGHDCWELDALDPNILRQSVADTIDLYIDDEAWERAGDVEDAELKSLREFFDANSSIFGLDPK